MSWQRGPPRPRPSAGSTRWHIDTHPGVSIRGGWTRGDRIRGDLDFLFYACPQSEEDRGYLPVSLRCCSSVFSCSCSKPHSVSCSDILLSPSLTGSGCSPVHSRSWSAGCPKKKKRKITASVKVLVKWMCWTVLWRSAPLPGGGAAARTQLFGS